MFDFEQGIEGFIFVILLLSVFGFGIGIRYSTKVWCGILSVIGFLGSLFLACSMY